MNRTFQHTTTLLQNKNKEKCVRNGNILNLFTICFRIRHDQTSIAEQYNISFITTKLFQLIYHYKWKIYARIKQLWIKNIDSLRNLGKTLIDGRVTKFHKKHKCMYSALLRTMLHLHLKFVFKIVSKCGTSAKVKRFARRCSEQLRVEYMQNLTKNMHYAYSLFSKHLFEYFTSSSKWVLRL